MYKAENYIPGLNGLRFFAAIAVIITHVELVKGFWGIPNVWNEPIIQELGPLGVLFFFVLSGFLISYLLLREQNSTGTISFKRFYLRRIYRIFPLYYLAVFFGFGVFYHIDFLKITFQHAVVSNNFIEYLLLYVFFMPNITLSFFETSFPHFGQLWSIGVEEHFYLIWPLLLFLFRKKTLVTMVLFFFGFIALKILVWYGMQIDFFNQKTAIFFKYLFATEKLESMALGGVGAWFYLNKYERIKQAFKGILITPMAITLTALGLYFFPTNLVDGAHVVYSFSFLACIFNVIFNPFWQRIMEFKQIKYGGVISFGIYVYHLIIVTLTVAILSKTITNTLILNVSIYIISIAVTLLISHVSYKYYETYFLNLKKKFQTIR